MPSIILTAPASNFDVAGNNDLMLYKGNLRGRPRDKATDTEMLAMMTIPSAQASAILLAGNKSVFRSREQCYGGWWDCEWMWYDNTIAGKHSDVAVKFRNYLRAGMWLLPNAAQLNPNEFTIRVRMQMASLASNGYLFNDLLALAGIERWGIYWDATGDRLVLRTYDVAGSQRQSFIDDLSNFSVDTWYQWQITYSAANTRMRVHVKNDVGVRIISGEQTGAKVLPTPEIYSGSTLYISANRVDSATTGSTFSGGHPQTKYIDWITYIDNELAYDFVVASAVPTIYATGSAGDLCEGATVTLDSELDGTTWDASSTLVDDLTQWAASVGGNGWTLRYEATDNASPGTYSAWMTLATFLTETNLVGRYIHYDIRCHDATGLTFYLFSWLSIEISLPAVIVNQPTFTNLTNDGDGDAITVTLTPPATGEYDDTVVYYRQAGTSAWSSVTYVGAQGVQGTKQITGLTDHTYYEVYLAARKDGTYSQPTGIKSIFCTSGPSAVSHKLGDITGMIVKALQDDAGVKAKVGSRVYPDESNVNPDADYPLIAVIVRQDDKIRAANALEISVTIVVYDADRFEAEIINDLVEAALDNQRISATINADRYAGVLQNLSRIEVTHEGRLVKWYVESDYEGRFIKRSS